MVRLQFASRERRAVERFHRVWATCTRAGCARRYSAIRRKCFGRERPAAHAYVMVTPEQCLAGLFFFAAALALVGFFGLFFAMAYVRLVIPLALGAKVLQARVTELPKYARCDS